MSEQHQWTGDGACTLSLSLLTAEELCGMCGCLAREHVGWVKSHPTVTPVPVAFDANGGEVEGDAFESPRDPEVEAVVKERIELLHRKYAGTGTWADCERFEALTKRLRVISPRVTQADWDAVNAIRVEGGLPPVARYLADGLTTTEQLDALWSLVEAAGKLMRCAAYIDECIHMMDPPGTYVSCDCGVCDVIAAVKAIP